MAADEVRIKLSELCYKTISSDIIEDKKHIDLSAEPLILVMAAGSPEIVLEDIVKDTAIFKAHAARVVVITDEGETRFDGVADHVIKFPGRVSPSRSSSTPSPATSGAIMRPSAWTSRRANSVISV